MLTKGFKSGYIKVYNVAGKALFSHQPHVGCVLSIKIRTAGVDESFKEDVVVLYVPKSN
jgi:hypothetical protein